MSLAETLEKSDFQMNEADRAEFVERVLFDGEEIVAAFKVSERRDEEPRSIVFTSKRLVLEREKIETDRYAGYDRLRGHDSSPGSPVQKRLISVPYGNISMYSVVLDVSRDPDSRSGVLRLWVPGYYNDGNQSYRWIDIPGDGKLDLYMLSGILASRMAM